MTMSDEDFYMETFREDVKNMPKWVHILADRFLEDPAFCSERQRWVEMYEYMANHMRYTWVNTSVEDIFVEVVEHPMFKLAFTPKEQKKMKDPNEFRQWYRKDRLDQSPLVRFYMSLFWDPIVSNYQLGDDFGRFFETCARFFPPYPVSYFYESRALLPTHEIEKLRAITIEIARGRKRQAHRKARRGILLDY